jgi:hypothetical membrane protein
MSKESNPIEDETLEKKVNKISYITMFGIVQFLILSIIAMIVYPGSHKDDLYTEGYLFNLNKFSDLGAWETYSGESNLVSFLLFNIGMIIVGLSLIPYVIFSAKYFMKQKMPRYLVIIGAFFGILACVGFICVGLTPRDLLYELHKPFEYAAFLSIFVMSLIYMLFIYKDSDYPNKYTIIYAICVVFQFIYLFIVFDIIIVNNEFDAIAQKLIVYLQLVVFLIQSIGILHLDKD